MKKFIALSFVSITLMSCYTHSFTPQTQNVPLFTEKGELEFNVAHSYRSADHQIAYSPLQNIGVMSNIAITPYSIVPEIGIGTYGSINKKSVFEIFSGYAFCRYVFHDSNAVINFPQFSSIGYKTDILANRFFIQPVIGQKFSDKVSLSLSAKFCYWQFLQYNYYGNAIEKYEKNGTIYHVLTNDSIYNSNVDKFTIEPSITLKVGGAYGKVMLQTGFYYTYKNSNEAEPYRSFPLFIRAGFNLNLNLTKFKKRVE